jgi:TetR/AcrR family transcriptional repressor of bet genes
MDRRKARVERIARAALDLACRDGVERVTLRSVAAEASVSMGQVQHYFSSKDELAIQGMEARVNERIDPLLAAEASEEAVLRALLEEMVGRHPEGRCLIRLGAEFVSMPAVDPRITDILNKDDPELRDLTVHVIRVAQEDGRVDPRRNPEHEATIVWAIVGELGYEVAHGHRPVEEALEVLGYHLDLLLGSRN